MAVIKLRGWQLILVRAIVLPVLERICKGIEEKAAATPEEWDDVLAGAFRTVVEFLKGPGSMEET